MNLDDAFQTPPLVRRAFEIDGSNFIALFNFSTDGNPILTGKFKETAKFITDGVFKSS